MDEVTFGFLSEEVYAFMVSYSAGCFLRAELILRRKIALGFFCLWWYQ